MSERPEEALEELDTMACQNNRRGCEAKVMDYIIQLEAELGKAREDVKRLDKLLAIGGLRLVKLEGEAAVRHYHLHSRLEIDRAIDRLEEPHE